MLAVTGLGLVSASLALGRESAAHAGEESVFERRCTGTYLVLEEGSQAQTLWTFHADRTLVASSSGELLFAFSGQQGAWRPDGDSGAKAVELDFDWDAAGTLQAIGRVDIDEQRLEAQRGKLEKQALEQAQLLRQKIAAEVASLETYAQNLDSLDQQARLLVGEIAMRNFALVRDRVKNIVLRADVGIVQQAWEVREEQRVRVRNLQRERAREEQNLNDELREVLDDAEDSQ